MRLQKELVQKALNSNRKLVVLGHELELIDDIIPIEESRITHIVCGHLHKASVDYMEEKNIDGDRVQKIRVGSFMFPPVGWTDPQMPISYSVSIAKDQEGKRVVEVKELKMPNLDEFSALNDLV